MAGRWTNATLCVLLALLVSEASALPLPLPASLLQHLRLQLTSEAPIYPDAAARFPHQIFTAISEAIDDFPRREGDENDYLLRSDDARARRPGSGFPASPDPSYTPPERHWDVRRPWGDTTTGSKTAVAQDSRSRVTTLLQVVHVPQKILALVRGLAAPAAWHADEERSSDESAARRGSREAERIQISRLGELRRRHQPSYIAAKERLHRQLDPERRKGGEISDSRPLRSQALAS